MNAAVVHKMIADLRREIDTNMRWISLLQDRENLTEWGEERIDVLEAQVSSLEEARDALDAALELQP